MPDPAHSAQSETGRVQAGGPPVDATSAQPPQRLVIEALPHGRRIVVTVRGSIGREAQEQFRGALHPALRRAGPGVVLDISGVAFRDCRGLDVLLEIRRPGVRRPRTTTAPSAGLAARWIVAHMAALSRLTGTEHPSAGADEPYEPYGGQAAKTGADGETDARTEVAQLRRAMQTRPTIDLARGILMAAFSLSPAEAWTALVTASQNTNTKLHRVAQQLVDSVQGEELPPAVRTELSAAVTKLGTTTTDQRMSTWA